MTHDELHESVCAAIKAIETRATEAMEALEARLMDAIGKRDLLISRLDHQQTQATTGFNTRVSMLEKERIEFTRTLAKLDARIEQLSHLAPALKDLRDLMAIWARQGFDGDK